MSSTCPVCGRPVYDGGPGARCTCTGGSLRAEVERQERYIEKLHRLRRAAEAENAKLRAAYDHLMEIAVAAWHDADSGKSLIDWLEVSWDEYAAWLKAPEHVMSFKRWQREGGDDE